MATSGVLLFSFFGVIWVIFFFAFVAKQLVMFVANNTCYITL